MLTEIRNQCLLGPCSMPHCQFKHDMLLWNNRLVIPHKPEFIKLILTEFHSSMVGGHARFTRTKMCIATQTFWAIMTRISRSLCRNVQFVNKQNTQQPYQLDYSNLFLFHHKFGKICRWFSLRDYHNLILTLLFSWLYIVYPNIATSSPSR